MPSEIMVARLAQLDRALASEAKIYVQPAVITSGHALGRGRDSTDLHDRVPTEGPHSGGAA